MATKITIQDVFAMFEPFGMSAKQVNSILDNCKDRSQAFNVFEGLKSQVMVRYEEMRAGEVSAAKFQEVKPIYDRLMGIMLKNYTPKNKRPKPSAQVDRDKLRRSKSFRKVARIGEMMRNKDVDGLMGLLDSDSGDPVEREASEALIREFERIAKNLGKKK